MTFVYVFGSVSVLSEVYVLWGKFHHLIKLVGEDKPLEEYQSHS